MELASPEDWHALAELERACFPGDRISPRSWRSFLASQSAVVTVARGAGSGTARSTLIGAAVVLRRATTSVARLYSMAIATSARGRGVSTALLEDATQRMRDAGAAVLRLETRLDNVAAQRLFAKCGFVQRGRKASYYEDGEDALLYQKSLWNSGAAALGAPCSGRRRQTAAVVISKEY
jgi:ribosomal protein S18 acetylase RimI-like enzyme